MTTINQGGVCIVYTNFEDITNSPHRDLIDINLKNGVSPYRLCNFLKKEFNCSCNKTKLKDYRSKEFPDSETIRNAELIKDISDNNNLDLANEEQYSINDLVDLRLKLGIKTGNRISEKLDNDESLDAKETQLFAVCCKLLDKDSGLNETPEIEVTEEDVEWINHVSSYD